MILKGYPCRIIFFIQITFLFRDIYVVVVAIAVAVVVAVVVAVAVVVVVVNTITIFFTIINTIVLSVAAAEHSIPYTRTRAHTYLTHDEAGL